MTNWENINGVYYPDINGAEYACYESAPSIFRLRKNGALIAETFTLQEGQRWAEVYDEYLEKVRSKKEPDEEPDLKIYTFKDLLDAFDVENYMELPRYPHLNEHL